MAPKKTLLVLTLILLTGITAAQSLDITSGDDEVWVNSGEKIEFDYTEQCNQKVDAEYILNEGEDTSDGIEFNSDSNTSFSFDSFSEPGSYNFTATCKDNTQSKVVEAGELELSDLSLTYQNGESGYPREKAEGSFSVNVVNEDGIDFSLTEENFSLSSGEFSESFEVSESQDVSFSFDAKKDMINQAELEISALGSSISTNLVVEPVWQVVNPRIVRGGEVLRDGVKYRNFQNANVKFEVLKKGQSYSELSADQFSFNPEDGDFNDPEGSNWFDLSYNGGTYNANFDSSPSIIDEGRVVNRYNLELDTKINSEDIQIPVETVKVEKDVEFSGEVRDLGRSYVPTEFTAYFEDGFTEFSTSESGSTNADFLKYFTDEKAKRMVYDFPEVDFEMKNFELARENPRGQEKGIRYNYYSEFGSNGLDNSEVPEEIRPVNLVSVESDYDFEEDPDVSRSIISFDSSQVEDIRDLVVYECTYWMFERETCSTSWDEKDVRALGQSSVSVPIEPYDEQFGGNANVLWNAYVVGVPRGVGSSLTLQESNFNGFPGRIQAGEEFTVSGTIIGSSDQEPVEGADVSIELVSDGNTVSSDGLQTDENGGFEYTDTIEEAGEYSVSLEASEGPYEPFVFEEDDNIEVFYETGLTVSSEENVDLQFGESSSIEFTVENVGQSSLNDLELDEDVSGIDESYFSWSLPSESSVEAGDSVTATLNLDVPSDSDVTPGQKTISLSVSGSSAGESLENSATVYATVPVQNEESESTDQQSSDEESTNSDSGSSFNVPNTQDVSNVTGEFIQSQSDMNLALGLILVFGAVLAVTVRKRKNGDDRDGRRMNGRAAQGGAAAGAGRGKVQRPKVSPQQEEEETEAEESSSQSSEEVEEQDSENESVEEGSDSEFVCDTCGDEFDTESGLKLHKQALH